MSPLWNLPLQGRIPYWGPQALSSSQPILCAHICVCACVSGGKPMVLVLLSFSSVSLVSYLQPSPCSRLSTCTVSQPPRTVHQPHSSVFGKTKLEDTASGGPFAIRDVQIWVPKPNKRAYPVISPQLGHILSSKRCDSGLYSGFQTLKTWLHLRGSPFSRTPTPDLMPNSFYYYLFKKDTKNLKVAEEGAGWLERVARPFPPLWTS